MTDLPADLVADPSEAQLADDDARKSHRADQGGILLALCAFESGRVDVLLDDGGGRTNSGVGISGRQCVGPDRNL